ncbi:MAG: molybdenum cofactor guanylyltransferase [Opitutales bacterium]|nr:molybdenum cofactor guanylyltransferase [Opitutales bacterium]
MNAASSLQGHVVGVLLAGGRSRRMGFDKALLEYRELPLWQCQTTLLREVTGTTPVVSARTPPEWLPVGMGFVADGFDAGPLGGIASVLSRLPAGGLALVLAVDIPFMPAEYLRRLMERARADRSVIPKLNEAHEPLAAVYSTAALESALEQIRAGRFSLRQWTNILVARGLAEELPVPPELSPGFTNINTPDDWPPTESP